MSLACFKETTINTHKNATMGNVYFLSDLHLGAKYLADKLGNEKRVVRFLDSVKGDAETIYLLGDILDYWYEYKTVVPRGFVRFFGKLAELADSGVKIYWITGNHDVWLFDYLSSEIGLTVLKTHITIEMGGKRFFLSHGDDVGKRPLMYRFMRFCFYNRVCQVLYAAIHPRWTSCIATGWSAENRTSRKQAEVNEAIERNVVALENFAGEYTKAHGAVDYFVFGHLHTARVCDMAADGKIVFLGDWIDKFTYAVFDGKNLALKKFE